MGLRIFFGRKPTVAYQYGYPISDISTGGWLAAPRNLLTYTEALDNVAWTKVDVTVTANATTDPWGGNTAEYVESNGGSQFFNDVIQSPYFAQDTTYTASIFAKAGENDVLEITSVDLDDSTGGAVYDLTLGEVADTGGDVTAGITSVGSGWYRCWLTWYSMGGSPASKEVSFGPVTVNNSEGIYLTGAQVEVGSSPTEYQMIAASYDDTILYRVLDETSADDADYIYSPANPTTQQFEVRLTSLSDPLSSSNHTITIRLQAIGENTNFDLDLVQNTTVLDSWTENVTVAAGVVERSRTFSGAVADSITDYTNLRIRGVARAP